VSRFSVERTINANDARNVVDFFGIPWAETWPSERIRKGVAQRTRRLVPGLRVCLDVAEGTTIWIAVNA
jgi:hypothetical protein